MPARVPDAPGRSRRPARKRLVKLPGFVPEDLRQLLRFVPMRGWDAVAWRPMLASLRALSWRYASGSGVRSLGESLAPTLTQVRIGTPAEGQHPLIALSHGAQRKAVGDRLLHLYFRQWRLPRGQFIDFRPGRFTYGDGELCFTPNGLWLKVSDEFRTGLLALYRAFYADDEAALEDALRRMGMLREGLDAEAQAALKALLRAHFGIDQGAQRFSIDAFKTSFDELFEFFLDHGYTLQPDFVVLGFNLITLYLTLEQLGQAHNVRGLCLAALVDSD